MYQDQWMNEDSILAEAKKQFSVAKELELRDFVQGIERMDALVTFLRPRIRFIQTKGREFAEILASIGYTMYMAERYELSLWCLDQCVMLDQGYSKGWLERSKILIAVNRIEEALKSIERALEITPNDKASLMLKGDALRALGRNDEAIMCFWAIVEQDKNDLLVYDKILKIDRQNKKAALGKAKVSVRVITMRGRPVRTYPAQVDPATGDITAEFPIKDLSPGDYYAEVTVEIEGITAEPVTARYPFSVKPEPRRKKP